MAQLVRVDVTDAGEFGDGDDVTVDGASLEWLAIVAFDEEPGVRRTPAAA